MRSTLAGVMFAAIAMMLASGAQASTLTPLYGFCQQKNCTDGRNPFFPVTLDGSGNIYGVDNNSGADAQVGIVYRLAKGSGGVWQEKVLFTFCDSGRTCNKGSNPTGRVAVDPAGDVFGVTMQGNGMSDDDGIAYEVTAHGKLVVIGRFCTTCGNRNGSKPAVGLSWAGAEAGAPWDGVSPLYGTTTGGGTSDGTVFEIIKAKGSKWKLQGIADLGLGVPGGAIAVDMNGDVFYTTVSSKNGTLNELVPNGKSFTNTQLWLFCAAHTSCDEGKSPETLTVDATGNLFGTTALGAKHKMGAVYELAAPSYKKITVVHAFCSLKNCTDGANPAGTMTVDATGNVYGVTAGVIYEVGTDGSYNTLYGFCALANCADGSQPTGVTIDPMGNLFGATILGGPTNSGEVFEFTP